MKKLVIMFGMLSIVFQGYSIQQKSEITAEISDDQLIKKIEQSVQNLKLRSKILQISPSGEELSGTCLIYRKKGRAKLSVGKILVVVKDDKFMQYDLELKEKTESTYNSSPLAFLLDRKLKLSENVIILGKWRGNNEIRVRLIRSDPNIEGSITLIFSEDFVLKGWIVYNTNNAQSGTEIKLIRPKFEGSIDENEF